MATAQTTLAKKIADDDDVDGSDATALLAAERADDELDGTGDDEPDMEYLPGSSESYWYKTTARDNRAFLNSAPWQRGDLLRAFRANVKIRTMLEPVLFLQRKELLEVTRFMQGGPWWEWSRKCRRTGTAFPIGIGMSSHTRPLRGAFKAQYMRASRAANASDTGLKPKQWGNATEKYGAHAYVNHLLPLVVGVFRAQRRMGFVARYGCFVFRNQRIPVRDVNVDPSVEMWHFGQLTDFWNQWTGSSNDGVVVINGLPLGIFENKSPAPQMRGLFIREGDVVTCDPLRLKRSGIQLYSYMPEEYFCQVQENLYKAHRYWPTIRWADFHVYSPFTCVVDTVVLHTEWMYDWAIPRDLRYCQLMLSVAAERISYLASQHQQEQRTEATPSNPFSIDAFANALREDFKTPNEPMPTPSAPAPASESTSETTAKGEAYAAQPKVDSLKTDVCHEGHVACPCTHADTGACTCPEKASNDPFATQPQHPIEMTLPPDEQDPHPVLTPPPAGSMPALEESTPLPRPGTPPQEDDHTHTSSKSCKRKRTVVTAPTTDGDDHDDDDHDKNDGRGGDGGGGGGDDDDNNESNKQPRLNTTDGDVTEPTTTTLASAEDERQDNAEEKVE